MLVYFGNELDEEAEHGRKLVEKIVKLSAGRFVQNQAFLLVDPTVQEFEDLLETRVGNIKIEKNEQLIIETF